MVEMLSSEERELCSTLRIPPNSYLSVKQLFAKECELRNGLGKRKAREMVKIDVNKSSKIWEHLCSLGLVWTSGSAEAGSTPVETPGREATAELVADETKNGQEEDEVADVEMGKADVDVVEEGGGAGTKEEGRESSFVAFDEMVEEEDSEMAETPDPLLL